MKKHQPENPNNSNREEKNSHGSKNKEQQSNDKKLEQLIHKAEKDSALKAELILHPEKILEENGIHFPKNVKLKAFENTRSEYHLVIPEENLEKKYQVKQLSEQSSLNDIYYFIITEWQNNGPKKEELRKNPLKVLQSFGVKTPKNMKLHIHENTKEQFYFVIPKELEQELDELELRHVAGGKGHHHSHKRHLR